MLVGDVTMGEAVCEATWERIRRAPAQRRHLVIGNHYLTGEGKVRAQGLDDVWSVMTCADDEHGKPPARSPHINV